MATAKLPTTQPALGDYGGQLAGIPFNEWTANGATTAGAAVPFSLVVNEAIDTSVPSAGWLTTANGEVLHYSTYVAGTKTFTVDARAQQGTTAAAIDNGSTIGHWVTRDTLNQLIVELIQMSKTGAGAKGADVASAAALNIGEDGQFFHVTGTTTITSIETRLAGQEICLVFDGALTLTHNATSLILQGGTNLTTAAGDVLTFRSEGSGNWRETSRRLTTVAGGGDLYNLLTNPGFEVNQRGGTVTADQAYAHDRWQFNAGTGSSISITDETSVVDTGSQHSLKAVYTHVTGASQVRQALKNTDIGAYSLRGRTVTFRLRGRTATASAMRAFATTDGTGGTTTYSSDHSGGGAFENLDVSVTVPTDATYIIVGADFRASCTAYMDNTTFVIGSSAQAYYPLHPADEWERCQRYYEVHGGVEAAGGPTIDHMPNASGVVGATLVWLTRKAVTPTATKSGTWSVVNCDQPAADKLTPTSGRWYVTSTAAGQVEARTNGTDDTLAIEANP